MVDLSYHNINGNLFHYLEDPLFLHVMLIIPSPIQGAKGTVHQRLCLGKIYLNRWLEASPKFDSIVLE